MDVNIVNPESFDTVTVLPLNERVPIRTYSNLICMQTTAGIHTVNFTELWRSSSMRKFLETNLSLEVRKFVRFENFESKFEGNFLVDLVGSLF